LTSGANRQENAFSNCLTRKVHEGHHERLFTQAQL
jgi:hypothetical protein